MKETRGWKESVNKGKKDHLNRLKDAPPFSKAQQQQPKTHWLGPNLIKKQKEFRKIFEFPEDEEIVASFNCSMRAGGMIENMVQGTMYITTKHVCFHSTFWGTERKEAISFGDVRAIEKRNTARIIPNALEISVARDDDKETKYFFGTFLNRHEAYKVLQSHWERRKLYQQSLEVSQMTNTLSQQELLGQARIAMSKVAERYEVTRPLGEGGFGKAFVVLDKQDFRQYVLKRMDCGSEEEAANAVKEMVLLRLMKHPYIVGYRDFWRDNLTVYIVMEYCEGGDMALLIEQQQSHFSEQEVLRWLIQAVLAIEHMHAHNVLHRDIKPNNLFLNRWQDLKLGDFGLSAVTLSGSKLLHAVGTLGYAAPEILRHKPYDSKSDIYALGCTLYEIVTLRSVYDDQNLEVFPVPIPPEYSRDLEKLIQAMLSKDPERRPSASEILAHPLLAPFLGKISTESEIYGEMQQREDENQQLLLKLRLLEAKLQGKLIPDHARDPSGMLSPEHDDGLYEDVYDPLLSMARPADSSDYDSDGEKLHFEDGQQQQAYGGSSSSSSSSRAGSRSDIREHPDEEPSLSPPTTATTTTTTTLHSMDPARVCAAASEWREACVCLLPRLPLSLTVAGVGVGALLRLAYCWAPLWAAVAFVLLPSLAQEGKLLPSSSSSTWAAWLRLGRGAAALFSVLMAPVGALLLISALDDDLLFSVSLLLLFAACPALSALARRAEVSATVLNSSVGAVFGLATGMRGVAGPTGLAVVGSVFGIAHLAARRWLAPLLSRSSTGVMGVMSYVGVQLLVGLAAVHAITAWCLPLAPASDDDGHAHHSFAAGAVLCVGASLVCALGCALPRRRRGGRAATIFCAAATLAALLVAAKALAAGLLACP